MLKNYMKEGQKLPLFGVGPYIVYGIAMVNVIGIILFGYVLKIGILYKPWIFIFRVVGTLLIIMGIGVWYIGAVRSDMDDSITENRLQTNGIYSWVRNPMYSGWWFALSGITLMWHNAWLHRGFGALSLGGLVGIPISIYGILSNTDYGLSLWMLTGAVLCALFAGLIFVTFKREE